jgi:hypothetical protein
MKGRGCIDFIKKIGGFLRKHKIISGVGNTLATILPGQYGAIAGTIGKTAQTLGFGRRRKRRCGRGLRLAGS